MTEFKIGDWVTVSWHKTKELYQITGIWEADTKNDVKSSSHPNSSVFLNGCANRILKDLEPWQPKEGEWCWFIMNADESSLRQWTNSHNDNKQLKACMCEPFIGELPSWIKDK